MLKIKIVIFLLFYFFGVILVHGLNAMSNFESSPFVLVHLKVRNLKSINGFAYFDFIILPK